MSPESPQELAEGTELAGFQVVRKIGEGGMGKVYLARQVALQREVALKVLHPRLVRKNQEFIKRFLREASLAAKVNHPNVVQVIDAGEEGGIFFLAMENVAGRSVLDLLKAGGAFPETVALEIARQAALALEAAHQRQLIHRDVKPDNFILTPDGVLKVADFGLAKHTNASSNLTRAGILMGTPAYISPEQVQGAGADHRSDLYSLGITLFEMAVGVKPFRAESVMALLMKHVMDPVPDPRDANPTLSGAFIQVLRKMTAKDPSQRYRDATEAIKAIEAMPLPPDGRKLLSAFLRRRFPDGLVPDVDTGEKGWARKAMEEAKQLGQQKDFQSAISLLKKGKATSRDPKLLEVFQEKTEKTSESERHYRDKARRALDEAEKTWGSGDTEKAIEAFRSVCREYPGSDAARQATVRLEMAEARCTREKRYAGVSKALAGSDPAAAKKALKDARSASPSGKESFEMEEGFEKEIRYFEHLERGRELQARGRWEQGEEAFAKARALFDRKEARVGIARMRANQLWARAVEARTEGDLKKENKFLNQAKGALDVEGLQMEKAIRDRMAETGGRLEDRKRLKRLLKNGKGFESACNWSRARLAYRQSMDLAQAEGEKKPLSRRLAYVARREDLHLDRLLARAKATAEDGDNRRACAMLDTYLRVRKVDPTARQMRDLLGRIPDGARLLPVDTPEKIEVEWLADGAVMVLVPGGPFFRGSKGFEKDEEPASQVGLTPYFIEKTPVTNAQYLRFHDWVRKAPNPHRYCHPLEPPDKDHTPLHWGEERWNSPQLPVVGVDWFDAFAFASWAGKRLPFEAQWEKAARGESKRTYPWGDTPPNSTRCSFFDAGLGGTTPPSDRPGGASPYGILDMAGNVMEWCFDFFAPDFYRSVASKEPDPVNLEETPKKVLRGGSWISVAKCCRASFRDADFPSRRNNYIGFRCTVAGPS